eukprot:3250375-Alexandrium_andersonii.AAC.1
MTPPALRRGPSPRGGTPTWADWPPRLPASTGERMPRELWSQQAPPLVFGISWHCGLNVGLRGAWRLGRAG